MSIIQNPRFNHSRSINFDGVGYLRNNTNHQLGIANAWSLMIVTRPLSAGAATAFFQTTQASGANRIHISFTANGTIIAETRDSGNVTIKSYSYNLASVVFFTNRWYTLLFTWDGSSLVLYVNGVLASPTTLTIDSSGTMTDSNARRTSIGAEISGTNQITAIISQVAMWNIALSASDALSLYANGNAANVDLRASIGTYTSSGNLRHWWLCGAAGIVQDIGSSIFGTIDLTADLSNITEAANCIGDTPSEPSYGRWGEYSIDMDGSTERLRTTTARTIGIANAWSILFFVKSGRDTTQETIFELRSSATNTDRIRFQKRGDLANAPLEVDIYSSGAAVIKDFSFNNVFPVNTWVGICATWDGTTLLVYKNGVPIAPDTVTSNTIGTMSTTARQVGFGLGAQADQFFQGRVHSAAIWSSAHSDAQARFVSRPYVAQWLNFNTNGMDYTEGDTIKQWFRQGIGSLNGVSTGGIFTSNDVLSSVITLGGLNQGAANINIASDVFRDSPS